MYDRGEPYIKTDTSYRADLVFGQRRKEPVDGLDVVGLLSRRENGGAGEDCNRDILTLIQSLADVEIRIDGLSDDGLSWAGLGGKSHEACGLPLALYSLFFFWEGQLTREGCGHGRAGLLASKLIRRASGLSLERWLPMIANCPV